MSSLDIKGSWVLEANMKAKTRLVVNQGGARSGKTYSILLSFIIGALSNNGEPNTYDIIRKTLPALEGSAMRDFFDILKMYGLYDEKNHTRARGNISYTLNGNPFYFYSLDDEQKVRGRKRDYALLNEANEFDLDSYDQIMRRLNKQCYMDFNPSDPYHFIWNRVIPRDDCTLIKSTYLDNLQFLKPELVKEIERAKNEDENAWLVYGLGERGLPSHLIYRNWEIAKFWPESFDETIYGLDFGYNNQTALIEINFKDNDVYEKQIFYETEWTNNVLINEMNKISLSKTNYIYADNEDKNRIEEIKKTGYNVKPSDKSVKDGIEYCQRGKTFLHPESSDLIREKETYQWKQKNGMILDEPVKFRDHLMDAERYARYTHSKTKWQPTDVQSIPLSDRHRKFSKLL
jgi:phage terminase large subunit